MELLPLSSTFHQLTPDQLDTEINKIKQDMQENPEDTEIDQMLIAISTLQKDMIEHPENAASDQAQINLLNQQLVELYKENPHLMDGKDFSCQG